MLKLTINGNGCGAKEGVSIISVAAANAMYIPTICHHPDLPPFCDLPLAPRIFRGQTAHQNQPPEADGPLAKNNPQSPIPNPQSQGCGLCVVEVDGLPEPVRACHTPVTAGMAIRTDTKALKEQRRAALSKILATHPHACLTCAQREGCSLEDCSANVPKEERCCSQFQDCELRRVAEYVGIKEDTPRYRPAGAAVLNNEPLIVRDFNLCIDCARCVRACNQLRGVDALGLVHSDGRLVVGSVAATLIESACRFCGACVEVCPTGCLSDKGTQVGDREQRLVPCVHTCPAGVDVPGYIRRIAAGDYTGAAALVWETLPLANVLGHICFHLCENECRRGDIDDQIAICALKRFALVQGNGAMLAEMAKRPDSGKKVAVVGAGPAGLSAAYFLRSKGHAVTVFEAYDSPGGMPALSVPAYRLPKEVLEKDVSAIANLGVEIQTGHRLGTGEEIVGLLDSGYGAVLVAVGLPQSRKIDLDGSELSGVFWGLEFLIDAKRGKSFDLGRRIVVVGGGNVAVDVAMTALRLASASNRNARPSVRMICLESREEMPAHAQEIEKARAEGVVIEPGWGPVLIRGDEGKVGGVELRRCVSVFDEQRNFAPTFDDGERMEIDADTVILAVGQAPPEGIPLEREGVFWAGDIADGSAGGSVVHAVASGRSAATRIDEYFGGDGDVSLRLVDHPAPDPWIGRLEGFAPCPRVEFSVIPAPQRCQSFRLVEGAYSPTEARAEARRCLQCDLRLQIEQPPKPPEKWLAFDRSNVDQVPQVEGIFILADADGKPVAIKGSENVHSALADKLESQADAKFFLWEADRMFTKRESELIGQHLTQYGELPGGGDDELDDLF